MARDRRGGYTSSGRNVSELAPPPPSPCCREPDTRSLAEVQTSIRLRVAEGKLAAIAERCRQPDQLLGTQVLVDRDAILAIIGSEEESRRG